MTEQRRDDRVTDAAVDAAWRQAAQEEPPAEVDAAILAAARAAARRDAQEPKTARAPRRWTSWQPLAAAAGVIGLSLLLVQMLPRDRLAPPPATRDAPRAPAAPRAALESAARQAVTARPESQAAWASRIAGLHGAGDLATAEAELRAFRAAYPDADDQLPEAVRAWARSVSQDGTR